MQLRSHLHLKNINFHHDLLADTIIIKNLLSIEDLCLHFTESNSSLHTRLIMRGIVSEIKLSY
jgi:hypothetical protein